MPCYRFHPPTESREKRAGWKPFYGRAKISTKQKIPFRLVEQKATNEIFLPTKTFSISRWRFFCVKKFFIQGKACTPTIVLWSETDVKQQRQPSGTVSEGTLHAELCETLVTYLMYLCVSALEKLGIMLSFHGKQTVRSWSFSQSWIDIQFYVERFVIPLTYLTCWIFLRLEALSCWWTIKSHKPPLNISMTILITRLMSWFNCCRLGSHVTDCISISPSRRT